VRPKLEARLRIALVGAVVAVLALAVSPAQAAFPGQNGKIAFTALRDGNAEIYTMNADGTGQTRLTNNAATDTYPRWSADGTKIVFMSDRAGGDEIYSMNADGTAQTRLTNNPVFDGFPSWSPDGRIVFVRELGGSGDPNFEIYTMNADGTGEVRITDNWVDDTVPSWSPDGTKIAFTSNLDGNDEIYTMNPDGTGVTRLTDNFASDDVPTWSPDGSRIAFYTYRDAGVEEVYVINANGTGETRLTNNPASDFEPSWAPDGTKIAFATNRDGNVEIYTMNADGTGQTRLTNNAAVDAFPDWQRLPAYPHPKGASPMRTYFVPAYRQCTAPNRTHGAPLEFPSCSPPVQASNYLTVGTPDANGAGANSVGFLLLKVKATSPEDLLIKSTISDVRCKPATAAGVCAGANAADGTDYSGELQSNATIRITDRDNGPGRNEAATVQDIPFPVNYFCHNTSDASFGGECTINTTALAVLPQPYSYDGKRSVVEIGQLEVTDGGPDGNVATADNTVFLRQGIFVP
jgi:Tol biopolymer transport system component